MEAKDDTEIDIEDIGTILKSSRLKGKKSLEEISNELCIRKIYLTALEEGDYETLEPIPYGIGYVRTYARYLGLNPERAVKLYKAAAIEETTENVEDVLPEPEVNKSNKWHIIIGILALALVYGIMNICASDNKTKNIEAIESSEEIIATDIKEDANTQEKTTEETVSEPEVLEKEEKKAPVETEQTQEEVPTAEAVVPSKNKVLLIFSGETWLELKDRNKVYVQGVFHEGDKKEIDYKQNMFLSVGRPKNLTLYVNGEKKDVISKKRKSNIPVDSLK